MFNLEQAWFNYFTKGGPIPSLFSGITVAPPIGFEMVRKPSRTKIAVRYIPTYVTCKFVSYGDSQRLWLTDDRWYKSIGWCPHANIGGGECRDCALVLEEDEF